MRGVIGSVVVPGGCTVAGSGPRARSRSDPVMGACEHCLGLPLRFSGVGKMASYHPSWNTDQGD